jgi:hypothetical protein
VIGVVVVFCALRLRLFVYPVPWHRAFRALLPSTKSSVSFSFKFSKKTMRAIFDE